MEISVADYIQRLRPYVPGKPIEETRRELGLKNVIKLASNENPLGPSPVAKKAITRALKDLHRYPDPAGHDLREALSERLGVAYDQIVLGAGSNENMDFIVRTFLVAGDQMVCPAYSFIAFKICAQIHGVQAIDAPVNADYKADLGQVLKTVRDEPRVKLVYIANPNNPTGSYYTRTELTSLLEGLQGLNQGGRKVLLVLDDAYREYVTAADLPDGIEFAKKYPNVIVLRTFSKVYGLGGLRVGYSVSRPELAALMQKVRQPFNVGHLALSGALAALGDKAFVRRTQALNRLGMKAWESGLKRLSVPFHPSQGNFLLIDCIKGFGLTGVEVFEHCLKKGVIFRPVANYGLPGELRVSVGAPAENKRGLAVLASLKPAGRERSGRSGRA